MNWRKFSFLNAVAEPEPLYKELPSIGEAGECLHFVTKLDVLCIAESCDKLKRLIKRKRRYIHIQMWKINDSTISSHAINEEIRNLESLMLAWESVHYNPPGKWQKDWINSLAPNVYTVIKKKCRIMHWINSQYDLKSNDDFPSLPNICMMVLMNEECSKTSNGIIMYSEIVKKNIKNVDPRLKTIETIIREVQRRVDEDLPIPPQFPPPIVRFMINGRPELLAKEIFKFLSKSGSVLPSCSEDGVLLSSSSSNETNKEAAMDSSDILPLKPEENNKDNNLSATFESSTSPTSCCSKPTCSESKENESCGGTEENANKLEEEADYSLSDDDIKIIEDSDADNGNEKMHQQSYDNLNLCNGT